MAQRLPLGRDGGIRAISVGLALRAEIFDDPFVARYGFGDGFLHKLLLRVDLRMTAGNPFGPDELLRRRAGSFRVVLVANGFAVFITRSARTGNAELFGLHAPAGRGDFLVLAHEPADSLASLGTSATSTAAASGASPARETNDGDQRQCDAHENSRSQKPHRNILEHREEIVDRDHQLKSNRMAKRSDVVAPNVLLALVMG